MSAVWPIKVTGPLTPGMKGNKRDSKVNTIFSSSSEKSPLAGFVLSLHIYQTLLKRPLCFFFSPPPQLLAITISCPVSTLPVKKWCRRLFRWRVWGRDHRSPVDKIAMLTLDISDWCQMWPRNSIGDVVLLILLATMSVGWLAVVRRPVLDSVHVWCSEELYNHTSRFGKRNFSLFVETIINRDSPSYLSFDHNDIEYNALDHLKCWKDH